jgi:hypothetical protein
MAIKDILNATTIAAFIKAINQDYRTNFPDFFPPDSPLADLWNTVIEVKRDNGTDFSAKGVLDIFPFNFGENLKGNDLKDKRLIFTIQITITDVPDTS